MENKTKNIDILIGKVLSGNASSADIKELEAWKLESTENSEHFNKSVKVWENSMGWLSTQSLQQDKLKVQEEVNRALERKVRKLNTRTSWLRIAAVLVVPIALAASWLLFHNNKAENNPAQPYVISAPLGQVTTCALPDGSKVWINTNSTVSFDAETFNKKNREVEVDGEAYFDVHSDKSKPFRVKSKLATIVVSGTSFNVKTIAGSKRFETVLTEGSIELHLNTAEKEKINVIPGERVVFDAETGSVEVETVDTNMYSSWRKGELIFKDATLNDLIKELERIYAVKFVLKDGTLGEYRFRGMFSYNNNLYNALEKIQKTTGIEYTIQNETVYLKKEK